jgi:hypothetical protein
MPREGLSQACLPEAAERSECRMTSLGRIATSRRSRLPPLLHHEPSGRSVVTPSRRDLYLGPWGGEEAREAYDQEIPDWRAGVPNCPP